MRWRRGAAKLGGGCCAGMIVADHCGVEGWRGIPGGHISTLNESPRKTRTHQKRRSPMGLHKTLDHTAPRPGWSAELLRLVSHTQQALGARVKAPLRRWRCLLSLLTNAPRMARRYAARDATARRTALNVESAQRKETSQTAGKRLEFWTRRG
jgi:hypothetical protein